MKRLILFAGIALAFAAPAFAVTPIGPDVSGMGGADADKSDPVNTSRQPDRALETKRPEGSEPISGDAKAEAEIIKQDAPRSATHPSAPAPTGSTRGQGARGSTPLR
ncbi:MAG TPA: hypothetical protein VHP37_16935 [Burkholderiales bacterium]|nr:hypothetical protein [Burkholderiales bacterium]